MIGTTHSHGYRRFIVLTLSGVTTATLLFLLLLANRVHGKITVPAAPGSIQGHVQDETGRPLANPIYVALYAYPFQITNTNGFLQANLLQVTTPAADGFYAFTALPSGVYRVGFSDAGTSTCSTGACDACPSCGYRHYAAQFYSATLDLATAQDLLVMGAPLTGIDATMQRGAALTGTVTLSHTVDHTIEGWVTLYRQTPAGWQVAETANLRDYATPTFTPDLNPHFQFSGLAPGLYRLCATLRHTYPAADPGTAVLSWTGCYRQAAAAGQATLARLDELDTVEPIASASDITVTAAVTHPNLNLVVTPFLPDPLPDVAGIWGKVTTTAGQPLPGMRVTAYLASSTTLANPVTYTNQLGDYRLPLTVGGAYKLAFAEPTSPYGKLHYMPIYYPNVTDADKATRLAWQPGQRLPNMDVTLQRWPQISGTVQIKGGYVAQFGWLTVYRKDASGWTFVKTLFSFCSLFCTDNYNLHNGAYQLLLEPGIYRIAATARIEGQRLTTYYGGSTLEQATDLVIRAEDQIGNINIELDAERFETSLRGQVMADGAPQSGVRVELYNYGEEHPFVYVTTDAAGEYAVTGLLAGQYQVRALAPEPQYATLFYGAQPVSWAAPSITITPDAPGRTIDLKLPHAGALAGALRRYDGQPLSGATVLVHWYLGNGEWEQQAPVVATRTDAQGQWAVSGLLPGVYRVRYQHMDFRLKSIPHGTLDGAPGLYTPSDLSVKPDEITHTEMTIAIGYLRTPSVLPQRLFLPLVTR